ncbi:uncharacterized protein B4U80_11998 [Leptotrombidium deliense]|uniref:Peptidase M28 domain-containing protein n=1 Tax=Leptotrombidium deliense TaxID=299467 RepID=A0A443S029_9ACAR|nr:uncharacterized protein B4U80_11998 [Leptotrombidium deliense]
MADSIRFVKSRRLELLVLNESKIYPKFRTVSHSEPDLSAIKDHFDALNGIERHLNAQQKKYAVNYLQKYFSGLLGMDNVFIQRNEYNGKNIIGRIGMKDESQENKIIIIGAHYDTVENCTGVDDNSSGVIAVLELCRILFTKKVALSDVSIYCVLFDFEEEVSWQSIICDRICARKIEE